MARITQQQIAGRLGVSRSLVSRALTGRAREIGIPVQTIDKIRSTAHSMGYVPNAAARQLKGAGQKVIGLIAADMQDPFFGNVVSTVIRISHEQGYALTITGFDNRSVESRDIQFLLEQNLNGLVVVGSGSMEWVMPFINRRIPIVRLGSGNCMDSVYQISPDIRTAYQRMFRHLMRWKHKHIGFIGVALEAHQARLEVVKTLANKLGIGLNPEHIHISTANVLDAGIEGVKAIFKCREQTPTTIICSSDAIAMGALHMLAEKRVSIPGDVSVIGFDDLPMARLCNPPLTTLRQPINDMTELALKKIIRTPFQSGQCLVSAPAVYRSSTGPARRRSL